MKIIILGAGLTGLAASQILSREHDVLVLEKRGKPGGLASSFKKDGYDIPRFYHHVFKQEEVTKEYLRKAGSPIKEWQKVKMGIYVNGETVDFTNPLKLITWDYLSLPARIRFGLFGAQFYIPRDWSKLRGLDAEKWLYKMAGKEVTRKVFAPLMYNKFGMPLEDIGAEWLATRLAAKESTSYFGYPRGGIQQIVDYLVEDNDSKIELGARVKKIDLKKKYVKYGRKKAEYDVLINTIPMPVFLKLARGLTRELRNKWRRVRFIKHLSAVVAHDKPLDDFYWTNVFGKDFGGIIQHTYLNDDYPFKLSFVFSYAPTKELWSMKDKEVEKLFIKRLKEMYPYIRVKWARVTRSTYADPFCDEEYKDYKPQYETPIRGFYNAGIQVTSPDYMRSMNNSLMSGQVVAKKVLNL
ncbi:NAD(P)-binding protein [archaeon]|nr:NAD(P)-binding protein [archaeon]